MSNAHILARVCVRGGVPSQTQDLIAQSAIMDINTLADGADRRCLKIVYVFEGLLAEHTCIYVHVHIHSRHSFVY